MFVWQLIKRSEVALITDLRVNLFVDDVIHLAGRPRQVPFNEPNRGVRRRFALAVSKTLPFPSHGFRLLVSFRLSL